MAFASQNGPSQADKDNFADFLKPVKDMEKNWEINIAASLQTFLSKCESIDSVTLNFAEAGLVIQRSAYVYSRKVDHLHNLVYHALQTLNRLEKDKNKNTDGHERNPRVAQPAVFSLPDVNHEANIDLKDAPKKKSTDKCYSFLPLSLIPLEDADKGDVFLNSEKEILGNRMDYRLYSCREELQGALLVSLLGFDSSQYPGPAQPTNKEQNEIESDDEMDTQHEDPLPDNGFQDISLAAGDAGLHLDEEVSGKDQRTDGAFSPNETIARGGQAKPRNGLTLLNLDGSNPKRRSLRMKQMRLLDPHVVEPKRICREISPIPRYNVPPLLQVKDNNRKRRKRKINSEQDDVSVLPPSNDEQLSPIWDYCSTYLHFDGKAPRAGRLYNKSYSCLLQVEEKRRKTEMLLKKRISLQAKHLEMAAEDRDDDDQDDDDQGGDVALGDDPLSDLDDHIGHQPDFDALLSDDHLGTGDNIFMDQSQICDSSSYSEMTRQHVEQYKINAQKYLKTTEMDRRVNEWKERITPFLEEEDNRESFNISSYCTRLLNRFPENPGQHTLPFKDIVKDEKHLFEIPRFFLTSLFLTNHGNVSVSTMGDLEDSMNTMSLTLLSRKRYEEELEDYPGSAP